MINAIFFYRISRWLYLHRVPILPKLFQLLIFLLYNSKVAPTCNIGKGTELICDGIGVLIHFNSTVGKNCRIGAHACIVGKSPYRNVPQIGNDVFIGHNSIICGPVIVEDGVIIANGSVVLKSIPKNAIVAGAPATIVGYRDQLNYDFYYPKELLDDFMTFLK